MASYPPARCCTVGALHDARVVHNSEELFGDVHKLTGHLFRGEPQGKMIKLDDGSDAYIATPSDKGTNGAGIVYLPTVAGIWQNSKLMADRFAAEGYTTIIPDICNGDPVPLYPPESFSIAAWRTQGSDGKHPHTPETCDPVTVSGIKALKDMGIEKIGGAGYCFGAKYVVRHFQSGIDVGYLAHPSFVDEEELAAISGPISIAAAETDTIFPVEKRHKSEEILAKTGQPYQMSLFSGVEHGFAVRGDVAVKAQRFAKEQAFFQAVAWFDEWLLNA